MKPRLLPPFLVFVLTGTFLVYSTVGEGQCGSYSDNCQCGEGIQCFSIKENSASGTCVGHLVDLNGKDNSNLQSFLNSNSLLFFEISVTSVCNTGVDTNDLFTVTNTSLGTFSTIKELDYEDYKGCGCLQLYFTVAYADGTSGSLTFFVLVDVVNVNDNPPIFQYTQTTNLTVYNISVEETDTTNSDLFCTTELIATDQDPDGDGQITYEILPPSMASFSVSIDNNGQGLCVSNLVPLDRESITQVSFVIAARDYGNLTSNISVVLTLTDVNDNTPYFTQFNSTISVFENALNGTIIGQFRASDDDLGVNAELTFSIVSDSTVPFGIHQTGDLYVNGVLDADDEETSEYSITVRATDGKGKYTEVLVTIVILNVNDNPPNVNVVSKTNVVLKEGPTPTGNPVATFVVQDIDEDDVVGEILSGCQFVSLSNSSNFGDSLIFKLVYKVSELDYEQTPEILVNVSFTDDGIHFITASVLINVTDVNDNRPYLNQTRFSVLENTLPGTIVVDLADHFRDNDSSAGNNNVLDRFIATGNDYVSISMHGEIKVNDLDREKIPGGEITINVTFFDQGDPQLNNTEAITLNIVDINDNTPVFVNNYQFEVKENQPVIDFGQVHAQDNDTGLNGKVIYQIIDSDVFTIDNVTGKLSTVQSLDRETKDNYTITIVAQDLGTPSRNTSIDVIILVTDVNDNVPKFKGDIDKHPVVDADSPIGTVIGNYTAEDIDDADNAVVLYSINDTKVFSINATGYLITATELSNIYTDQIILLTAYNDNTDMNLNETLKITIEHKNATTPTTNDKETPPLPLYVVVTGGVVLVLLPAIFVVLCCICCLCYHRKHSKSRNLPPLPPQTMTPTKGIMKVSSFREDDDAVCDGSTNGDIPRSPTVNFSDNYQVRYFSQDQSMAKSSALNKTETVRLEEKLSTEFTESPQIPTKDVTAPPEVVEGEVGGEEKGGEEVSSPPLSEDLSSNSSLSNSVYHSTSNQYYDHQPKNQHLPLRVDTLKKHNEAISSGLIYPAQSHVGHDRLYGPPPHGNTSNGHYSHAINGDDFETLPPNIQHYLSSNHHSNQSISASHYVSQNGSPPSADSSPSIQFISHPSAADPRSNHRRLPHDKPATLPSVYYNNHHVVSHAPLGPSTHPSHYPPMDQPPPPSVYYDDPPPIQKNGPLQHYGSSSSSSSNHRPDVSPPSPPQSYQPHPPPTSLAHHHHPPSRHGRHSRDDRHPTLSPLDECPPPHHSYTTHSTRTHVPYHHPPPPTVHYPPQHHGPPPHLYVNMSRQSLAVSEDNSTVASSVLDTYLQFDTHLGKNDDYLLSDAISMDDR